MFETDSPSRLVRDFEQAGAIHLRGVLNPDQVRHLRADIQSVFAPLDQRASGGKPVRALSAAMTLRIKSVMQIIVHPRIVAALKAILEPHYQIIPDFHIHRNLYDFTDTRKSITHLFGLIGSGWHHDAGSEGAQPYLYDPRYRMVKCGLYLQDNTFEWGGGIDTAPGGHKLPLRTRAANLNYVAQRVWQNFCVLSSARTLDIKAGDFVAFDAHLPHRGAQPHSLLGIVGNMERETACVRLPPEKSKLVVYFDASRAALAQTYMRHSLMRGKQEYQVLRNNTEVFFSDFAGLRYPRDYPEIFVETLRANGLQMVQLEGKDLEAALALRQAALNEMSVRNYSPIT
jgi:hypothetical protein